MPTITITTGADYPATSVTVTSIVGSDGTVPAGLMLPQAFNSASGQPVVHRDGPDLRLRVHAGVPGRVDGRGERERRGGIVRWAGGTRGLQELVRPVAARQRQRLVESRGRRRLRQIPSGSKRP